MDRAGLCDIAGRLGGKTLSPKALLVWSLSVTCHGRQVRDVQ